MKIKTKLKISSIFILCFTLILLATFWRVNNEEAKIDDLHQQVYTLMRDVHDFNIIIQEYLIDSKEETYRKIEANLYFLNKELNELALCCQEISNKQQDIAMEISYISKIIPKIKGLFNEKNPSLQQKILLEKDIFKFSQDLLISSKSMTDSLMEIATSLHDHIGQTQNDSKYLVIIFLCILIFFTLTVTFTFDKNITLPIETLSRLSEAIEKGEPLEEREKYTFNNNDEITELSQAFKNMEKNLKKVQMEYQASERHFKLAETITNIATWEFKPEKNTVIWSENIKNILNLTNEEMPLTREVYVSKIHPEDRENENFLMNSLISGEMDNFSSRFRMFTSDGRTLWVEVLGGRHPSDGQELFLGLIRDITSRKEIDIELERQRYNLLKAQDMGKIGTWEMDLTNNEMLWTNETYKIFNSPLGQHITYNTFLNYVHPEDRSTVDTKLKEAQKGAPYDTEYRIIAKEKIKWVRGKAELEYAKNGTAIKAIGFIQDITRQKETEIILKQTQKLLKESLNNSQAGIAIINGKDLSIAYINNPAKEILKFDKRMDPTKYNLKEERARWEYFHIDGTPMESRHSPFHMALLTGKKHTDEFIMTIDKTTVRTLWSNASAVKDENGNILYVIIIFLDITERKELEKALKENEQKLRNIVENSTNLFFSHTAEGQLTYLSPQSEHFLDCAPEEGMTSWTNFLTDDPTNLFAIERTKTTIETGQSQKPFEIKLTTKKGRTLWAEVHDAPVIEDGKVVSIVGALTDITEKKEAEDQLVRQYNLLNGISEGASLDAVYCKDLRGRYMIINKYGAKILGLPKEKIIGRTDSEIVTKKLAKTLEANDAEVLTKKEPIIFEEIIPIDGQDCTFLTSKAPYWNEKGEVMGIIGIARDISDRKKTENLIRENEQRFKELFTNMRSGVCIFKPIEDNKNFVIMDFNRSAELIEGVKKEDILGKKATEIFPGIKSFGLLDVFKRVNDTGLPERLPISLYKDGTKESWRDNYVYKLPTGEIVAIYQDVTKEKKAQEELDLYRKNLENLVNQRTREIREINTFNERIISTIPSAIIVLNAGLKILNTNERFFTLFDLKEDKKIIGKNFGKAVENIDDKGTEKSSITIKIKAFMESEYQYTVFEDKLSQKNHPDQQKIYRFYLSEMATEAENPMDSKQVLVVVEDITKAKMLEQQLVQSERLAATGKLAASIAHEINNPLQGMSTHLDLMKDGLPEDTKKIKNYEHVKNNIKRIGEIVGQLLNIYRLSAREKLPTDINELLMQVINFVEYQMKNKGIHLRLKMETDLPKVLIWKQQIHQVFLNLILNGIESIEGTGTITITTYHEGDNVIIKIQDTGKGIPKEVAEHVFDPFFSTKKETGVGLGLFVCKGLIDNHKGSIELETKEGKGTTFTIKL